MVALRRVELPDLMQLTERLRDWPCPLEPKIEKTDIVMMNAPGGWAACALMPVPIPWSDLEWPAQAAAWRWRDAETSLREHKAHLLLHVRSD
jgi:hypothetical protein